VEEEEGDDKDNYHDEETLLPVSFTNLFTVP
jgi:hypothetical protein